MTKLEEVLHLVKDLSEPERVKVLDFIISTVWEEAEQQTSMRQLFAIGIKEPADIIKFDDYREPKKIISLADYKNKRGEN